MGPYLDLYDHAAAFQKAHPKYRNVHFEDGRYGSLWFDTHPAKVVITPTRDGAMLRPDEGIDDATSFLVEFSWLGERTSAEIPMGRYKKVQSAVKRAFELTEWDTDDIRAAFEQ